MNRREWIKAILAGERDVPVAQQWMGFFNAELARRLTPKECHYKPMWIYDRPDDFDFSGIGPAELDKMVAFNLYTGQSMSMLGPGANQAFGHGLPGEFACRVIEKNEKEIILEYETGVKAQVRFQPHFYHFFDHPLNDNHDVEKLILPDPDDPGRYEGLRSDAEYLHQKGEYVVGSLNGLFSALHYFLMDYEQLFMAIALEQDFIRECLRRLGEWNLKAAAKMLDAGLDGLVFCDDLGSKENLLISPGMYRDLIKPWHRRVCELAHERGATVHLHSHGAIQPILDDFVECGFDMINPFDPEEGHDIEAVLEKYADKFVVVGGFPTHFWSWPGQQQEEYLEKMGKLARKYVRYIFMDSGGVPEHVSKEDFERINSCSRRVRGVS